MYIAIPFEGRVRTLIRSSFVLAKRLAETTYNLSGDAFQMAQVTAEQALVFPDETVLEEGTALTDELLMQALPLESFVSVSAEEALPNVLGLLLRTAVADGRISDEELLAVQPALEGRSWRANVAVQVGDVFAYKGALWRCLQAHTTQGGWRCLWGCRRGGGPEDGRDAVHLYSGAHLAGRVAAAGRARAVEGGGGR